MLCSRSADERAERNFSFFLGLWRDDFTDRIFINGAHEWTIFFVNDRLEDIPEILSFNHRQSNRIYRGKARAKSSRIMTTASQRQSKVIPEDKVRIFCLFYRRILNVLSIITSYVFPKSIRNVLVALSFGRTPVDLVLFLVSSLRKNSKFR